MKAIVVKAKTDTERIAELEARVEKLEAITGLLSDIEKKRLEKEVDDFRDMNSTHSPSQDMNMWILGRIPRNEPKGMKFWY